MRNVLLIIQREYLVRVRTKAFLIFTVLMPLLVGAVVVLPSHYMLHASGTGTRHIVIAAADDVLANSIKDQLVTISRASDAEDLTQGDRKRSRPVFNIGVEGPPSEALRQQLIAEVRDGTLDGFAWIEADAAATRKGVYYSRGASDFIEGSLVSRALRLALGARQLADHGFSPAQAKALLGPVNVDTVHIDRHGANKSNGLGAFFLPFVLLMAIYMTVLIYGLYVMRSVLEEKTSRVVEVLLSSVSPMQLMAGKIIGVGAVGLTQIGIWAAAGTLLGTGSLSMAHEIVGDSMKDAHISTSVIILFPVFFILGYATYACLYAAIGAMVNSDEEAQQLQFPVTLPLILCMVFATAIIRDPNTPLAFWLSMFPLTSPIIMFVRVSVNMPPVWQIVASVAISLASLYGLVWVTSRIYRVGILMYGKRPTLPEILKWIRYA
jgi:ABC-2 type transport system permease protein